MADREKRCEADRQRNRPQSDPEPPGAGGNACHERLNELRSEGGDLLAASDQALDRALSGDSEQYLLTTRQSSGE